MGFLDYLYAIVAIGVIILLAYLCTKFIASKSTGGAIGGKTANMRVVDRLVLGKDKQILIVTVAEKAYLLGVSNQEISVLDVLDMEDLTVPADKNLTGAMGERFQDVLKKAADRLKSGKDQ